MCFHLLKTFQKCPAGAVVWLCMYSLGAIVGVGVGSSAQPPWWGRPRERMDRARAAPGSQRQREQPVTFAVAELGRWMVEEESHVALFCHGLSRGLVVPSLSCRASDNRYTAACPVPCSCAG